VIAFVASSFLSVANVSKSTASGLSVVDVIACNISFTSVILFSILTLIAVIVTEAVVTVVIWTVVNVMVVMEVTAIFLANVLSVSSVPIWSTSIVLDSFVNCVIDVINDVEVE